MLCVWRHDPKQATQNVRTINLIDFGDNILDVYGHIRFGLSVPLRADGYVDEGKEIAIVSIVGECGELAHVCESVRLKF